VVGLKYVEAAQLIMFNLNIYFLLYVISQFVLSHGYFITVDAHAEECFFDKVESGTKMGI
jgi:hypothetical protein